MATLHSVEQMNAFVDKYRLKELSNVVVGRDMYYLMPSYYNIKNLPYLAFYNKKGELIKGFEGSMSWDKLLFLMRNKGDCAKKGKEFILSLFDL